MSDLLTNTFLITFSGIAGTVFLAIATLTTPKWLGNSAPFIPGVFMLVCTLVAVFMVPDNDEASEAAFFNLDSQPYAQSVWVTAIITGSLLAVILLFRERRWRTSLSAVVIILNTMVFAAALVWEALA